MSKYKDDMLRIWSNINKTCRLIRLICGMLARGHAQGGYGCPRRSILMPVSPEKWQKSLGNKYELIRMGENTEHLFPRGNGGRMGFPYSNGLISMLRQGINVKKEFRVERRQIANDCFALAMKLEHYNVAHPQEEPLQTSFSFEEDIEEMKIARGLDEDDEAA